MPNPGTNEGEAEKKQKDNFNLKKLLGQSTNDKTPKLIEQNKNKSLEKSILDKIKN